MKMGERNNRKGSWGGKQGGMKEDKQPIVLQQVRGKILEAAFER